MATPFGVDPDVPPDYPKFDLRYFEAIEVLMGYAFFLFFIKLLGHEGWTIPVVEYSQKVANENYSIKITHQKYIQFFHDLSSDRTETVIIFA